MKCRIECFVVPFDHRYPNSQSVGQCQCATHRWPFPTGAPIGSDDLCPIGRIEDATEKALAAIAAAQR